MKDLPEDLEWKIIYVGSAESEEYDQVKNLVLENIFTSMYLTKCIGEI